MMQRYQNTEPEPPIKIVKSLFVSLDLGQISDYSALAIIQAERTITNGKDDITKLDCRFLKRWRLRTAYPQIVQDVVRLVNSLDPSLSSEGRQPVLAIDSTGCGAAVTDLFKAEKINAKLRPIMITGGSKVTIEDGTYRVPKRDLVAVTQVALQNRTLKIASQLPEAETLTKELANFKAKISDAGNDTYGAGDDWRIGNNDDLVLAVSMGIWIAGTQKPRVIYKQPNYYSQQSY
jgi:hypothetical protein